MSLTLSDGSTDLPAADVTMSMTELSMLYRVVVQAILSSDRLDLGRSNPKGDAVKIFDVAADRAAAEWLEARRYPMIVESEESSCRVIGPGPPRTRLIIDPVDGSDNWARGLPLSAFTAALLPVEASLVPSEVRAALVGPLPHAAPYLAESGRGAHCDGRPVTTSAVAELADALVSVELNHHGPGPSLAGVMAKARGVRCYGCAARALALVASGKIDAHIDVRRRLTAESYLAASALVLEAGGTVVGLDGAPLQAVTSLTEGVGLIAAASRGLAEQIVEALAQGDV